MKKNIWRLSWALNNGGLIFITQSSQYILIKRVCLSWTPKGCTAWQQKFFTKFLGFQYKVLHKKGADNTAADALSRHPSPAQTLALSIAIPQWLLFVTNSYSSDPLAQQLLQQLSLSAGPSGHFTLHQGVIKYQNKIWLGSSPTLQLQAY